MNAYKDVYNEWLSSPELGKDEKAELEAMEKALNMEKEQFLRLKKDEIIPFIEEELATRYWFQEAGVQIRLRYDEQLEKALKEKMLF